MADDGGISRGEYERLLSESMRRKEKLRDLTARLAETERALAQVADDRDKHVEDMKALAADRDGYKQKLETQPDELRQQVSDLTNQIRARTHRDKFNALAAPLVNPAALDAAWGLMGWKAEADEPDETKMTESIKSLVGTHSVLKIPADPSAGAGGGATATTQPTRAAGPGTSRGGEARQTDPNADLAARYPNPNRLA